LEAGKARATAGGGPWVGWGAAGRGREAVAAVEPDAVSMVRTETLPVVYFGGGRVLRAL